MRFTLILMLTGLWLSQSLLASDSNTTQNLYIQHCASCHGTDRLGLMGPALLPENLSRLRQKSAVEIILKGQPATQMPGFSDTLSSEQIQSLAAFIYTPLQQVPEWGMKEIRQSQIIHFSEDTLGNQPVFDADMLNLFIVVELGDHHATLLDGDRFEAIHRFKTRFALHGGPKYSSDGRFVYFASRDGWISKFDIFNLKTVAEIRAGINTRNIAVSGDDRYVLVGNYLPHSLVMLDARDLSPIKIIPVKDGLEKTSRVSAVYTALPRNSFIAAFKDIKEVWEISWTKENSRQAPFPIRRMKVDDYLDDFFFNQEYTLLIGASRSGGGQVINLDQGKVIQQLNLPGMPHLGSGITWTYKDRLVMATPNFREGMVSIIDMQTWETIKEIKTLGPGFFMRSHENTDYAWVDVFFGPNNEAVHIIDKNRLEIVKTIKPAPGKNAAHVEFDRYGKHALLSVWDMEGELIVYDAQSLKEVKRLPMKKPSGKYNVFNKVNRSAGTSH